MLPAKEIVVSVAAGHLAPEVTATITLVALDGDGGVLRELGAPGAVSIRTAVEGLEYVSCRSPLTWCPRVGVGSSVASVGDREAPAAQAVNLTAYALAEVAVPLVPPSGESLGTGAPPTVEGWLERESGTLHFLEAGTLDGNLLRWRGPAGRTDYRIAMEGWAPRYLFDRDIGAGTMQLEPLRLVRGSSVSLHALEESGLPVAGAAVRAEPYPPRAEDRTAPVTARAVTSEDGFAQLVGLDGEYYSLIVESEGRPPTRIEGVRLAPDAETRLAEVVLREFAEFRVFISPQAPSTGRWRVALRRLDQGAVSLMAEADPGGVATFRLATGSYLLDLQSPGGDVLHSELRRLAGNEAVAIDLDFVEVRGQVRLDGDGVQARVALSRGAGDRVPFVTNEEGEFSGQMPRPKGDVVAAAVETAGGLRRMFKVRAVADGDVLRLRFDLSGRTVRGVVLDGSTLEPLPDASVTIERAEEGSGNDDDPEAFVSLPTMSDQEGRFAFDGVEEGRYRLWAWLDGFTEGRAEVPSSPLEDWVVDDVRTVRLRLQPADPLDLLLTRAGTPLPAAMVEVIARSRAGAVGAGYGATDRTGRTRVLVPRDGAGPASVVVEAPPHLLWSGCVSLPSPGEPVLRLDLMDEPVGTVVLRNTGRDRSGGSSEPILVTPHGGVLTLGDLVNWSSFIGGAGADLATGSPIDRIELPGLSAGRYRVVESAAVDYGLYVNACTGVIDASAGAESVLVPGGRVELEVDLGFGSDEPVLRFPADL
jgi:hypothetical protein